MARRRLGFWQWLAVLLIKAPLLVLTRRNWRGAEHLPGDGGLIIAVNHISHADPLTIAHFVYEARRWPQFLIKHTVFEVPVLGSLLRRWRQIPVRRGTVDAAKALEAALVAVKAGDSIVIYPEGTTTKQPDLWPMRGRTGVARLALETGAPVVPVVSWGAQTMLDPRTGKLRLRPRIPVTVAAGPPLDLSAYRGAPVTSETLHEITGLVMLRLRDLLSEVRGEPAPPLWTPGGRKGGRKEGQGGEGRRRGVAERSRAVKRPERRGEQR